MLNEKELQQIKHLLDGAESNMRQVRTILFASEISKKAIEVAKVGDEDVFEGIFDGEQMIGADKHKYPVPANYASKSKLIPGDVLKLTILEDGSLIFKQIGPIKRKKLVGVLSESSKGKFVVQVESSIYRVLSASVTYFKASSGDRVTIIVPEEGESEWAAIENIFEDN